MKEFSAFFTSIHLFLFSKHILCKEGSVVKKKFDFEILTYLYNLSSYELIYAIFMVMYAHMLAYVCGCNNRLESKR